MNNSEAMKTIADRHVSRMRFTLENNLPALINVAEIKNVRVPPDEMFRNNFSPQEIKMIKEDVDYFIRDPSYKEQLHIFDNQTLLDRLEKETLKMSKSRKFALSPEDSLLFVNEEEEDEEEEPISVKLAKEQYWLYKNAEKRRDNFKENKETQKKIEQLMAKMEANILETKKPIFPKRKEMTVKGRLNEIKSIYKVKKEKEQCLANVQRRNKLFEEKIIECRLKK